MNHRKIGFASALFAGFVLATLALIAGPSLKASAAGTEVTQATPKYAISPTHLDIPYGGMSAILTVMNLDLQPERFEIKTYAWSEDGQTKKVETHSEPLVFPRMIQIAPGAQRAVSLGIANGNVETEKAYRILVQNLPGHIPSNGGMFRFVTSYDVPLFVEPQSPHPSTVITGAEGHYHQVTISAKNDGNAHSVIKTVEFSLDGKKQDQPILGYVLAKSHVDLNIAYDGCGKGLLRITPDMESGVPASQFDVDIPCAPSHAAKSR